MKSITPSFQSLFIIILLFFPFTPSQLPTSTLVFRRERLVAGHVIEGLLELLGHEGQLADTPDLGILSSSRG